MNQPIVMWQKMKGEQMWIARHDETNHTLVVSNPLRHHFAWSLQADDKIVTGGTKSNLIFAQQAAVEELQERIDPTNQEH
jgi:hypothetical protein